MINKFTVLILLALTISFVSSQSIPQIQPITKTLNSVSQYSLTYFSVKQILSTSYIEVNFNASNIQAPNGTINCTVKLNQIQSLTPKCSCTNQICKLEFNQTGTTNTKVAVTFGSLKNPHFTSSQALQIKIYFGPNTTPQNYLVTVSKDIYEPMLIAVNNFTQSDYGVGITNVTYTFNLSLPFIPKNPSLQIMVPSQVQFTNINFQLNFYGTVQNIQYLQVSNLLVFQIIANQNSTPNGFFLLKIIGFTNPKFIGNSSSFTIIILQTQAQSNCASCKVAELKNGLQASSNTPGDVQIISFYSNNLSVNNATKLTINMKLFAPIPFGGKVSIRLPQGIKPSIPVYCDNYFGFVINTTSDPYCQYNSQKHSIDTVNFAYPFLISQGSAIMGINVINAIDTRLNDFYFQTIDNIGRLIGKSRTVFQYSAQPLQLNVTINKNSTQIDTPFRMIVNMTIQTDLINGQKIKVIVPLSSNLQLNLIKCISSAMNWPCTSTVTIDGNLQILMDPPCVICNSGSKLSFSIDALNPQFINQNTQKVYIQTISSLGIIQAATINFPLKMAKLDITNYNRFGGSTVGDNYNTTLTFKIPNLVKTKGGILSFYFDQNVVFTDINVLSQSTYELKSSLSMLSNGVQINNTIIYYQNSKPNSIKSIFSPVCTIQGGCNDNTMTITLINLKQSFSSSPSTSCCWIVRGSTIQGWGIAQSLINTTSYTPQIDNNLLNLEVLNSIANQSSIYKLTFKSNGVLIQTPLLISLPINNIINLNGCYMICDAVLGFTFTCQIVNKTHVSVTYQGDPTLMINSNISYILTINNVTNPPALIPLTYSFSSKVNGFSSQEFSTTYIVQNPYYIPLSANKSNNTYGQSTIVTIIINNGKKLNYTQISVIIPKIIFVLPSSNGNSAYKLSENSSCYIISLTQDNDFPNNIIILDAINSNSTVITSKIELISKYNGYLSGKGSFQLPQSQPMFLKSYIAISNTTVGSKFEMNISFDRVNFDNSEKYLKVTFPVNSYSYQSTTYQGQNLSSLNRVIKVDISVSQPLKIMNLIHLKYVPDSSKIDPIIIQTLNIKNETISKNIPDMKKLLANIAAQSQILSVRGNNNSNSLTQISLTYTPLYAYSGCLMIIEFPSKQVRLTDTTSCTNGGLNCQSFIKSFSNSIQPSVNITYRTKLISLKNIMNLYPSSELLRVTLLTAQGNLIQIAQSKIQPEIALGKIDLNFSLNNGDVSTNSILEINATTIQVIPQGSKIQIQFDQNLFTKWNSINPTECLYTINNVNYMSCIYFNGTNGWLKSVTLSSLGPFETPKNTTIKIKLYLTNSWSAYPFANKTIVINVIDLQSNIVFQGSATIASLFSLQLSFNVVKLSNVSVSSSFLSAGGDNTLQFSMKIPVFTPAPNSNVLILLPKQSFIYNGSDIEKNDSSYYYISRQLNCSNKNCNIPNNNFLFNVSIKNSAFPKIQLTNIIIYARYDAYQMSQFNSLATPVINPSTISSMQKFDRSNNQANEMTQISMFIQLPYVFSQLKFNIKGAYNDLLQQYSGVSVVTGSMPSASQYSVSYNEREVIIQLSGITASSFNITIFGRNPLLVPKNQQIYSVIISNSSHYLYTNAGIKPQTNLIPVSTGVQIIRSKTTVGQETKLNIKGSVLELMSNMKAKINSTIQLSLSSQNFDIQIANTVNPLLVSTQILLPCQISNDSYIAYRNMAIIVTPLLTPVLSLINISFPKSIFINTEIPISIDFFNPVNSKNFNFSVPKFFLALTQCKACSLNGQCNIQIVRCQYLTNEKVLLMIVSQSTTVQVAKIKYIVQTVHYQTEFSNTKISINHSPPSGYYQQFRNITVLGTVLDVKIQLTSWKANNLSNYTITVKTIKNNGKAILFFPQQLVSQSSPYFTDQNGNQLTLLPTGTGLVKLNYTYSNNLPQLFYIKFYLIKNPIDDRPLTFTFYQTQLNDQSLIYGYSKNVITMKELDLITVYEAKRNLAKVSLPIILTLNINTPSDYSDLMIITLPENQVRFPNNNCSMKVDGITQICTYKENNTIEVMSVSGNHTYIIDQGISNALISVHPQQSEKVLIEIGKPYKRAKTLNSSTVFILPYTTAGVIDLLNFTSQNNIRIHSNSLLYQLNLQHWQDYTSIVFTFSKFNYVIGKSLQCLVNEIQKNCFKQNNYSLRINFNDYDKSNSLKMPRLNIKINNVYNFIQNGNYEISSIIFTNSRAQGNLDVYRSQNISNKLISDQYQMRVIIPYNYVNKEQQILIISDTKIPIQIPTQNFKANITANGLSGCQLNALTYNSTNIKLVCQFITPGTIEILTKLYYYQLSSQSLAFAKNYQTIYAQPYNSCLNLECNLCSTFNFQQYCLQCREGLSSNQGKCVEQCPQGMYSHSQSNRCLKCSPICKTCYDAFENNCLSCNNPNLVLDSGNCRQSCTQHHNDVYDTQLGDCTTSERCQIEGCRTCSNTGFCYQCLPDYDGEPNCQTIQILPPMLLTYFLLPFFGIGFLIFLYSCIRCLGAQSILSWIVFSSSTTQLIAWILAIPLMNEKFETLACAGVLILRIVLGIASYEIYYLKTVNSLSQQLLLQQQKEKSSENPQKEKKKSQQDQQEDEEQTAQKSTCKIRFVKFMGHFLGPDSYQLFKCKIGEPTMSLNENTMFLVFSIIIRILGMAILTYLMVTNFGYQPTLSDRLIVPILGLISSFSVLISRGMLTDIVSRCLMRVR